MEITIYLKQELIATLQYKATDATWYLVAETFHTEPTRDVLVAVKRATAHAMTDVFQPNGRVTQLDDIEYIAVPLRD